MMKTNEIQENISPAGKWYQGKWCRDLVLFAVTVLWFGTMARFGFDPHHDGIMLGAAAAVAEGKLLFKEVFCQYGALAVWIQSIFVKLFGAEDLVIKWATVLFYGLTAVVGTRIWERFLEKPFLWIWYGGFFLLCPFYLVPFHPWSSVYALFFMLLGVEGQLRFLEKGKKNWLILSGICAAAAFLCRTPCGVVAFGAGVVLLILKGISDEGEKTFAPLLPYIGGAAAVGVLFALYLTLAGAWSDYLRQCFTFIFGFVVKRGGTWSWTQFADSMIPLTGASGYGNCIFAILPFLVIFLGLKAVKPLFNKQKEELRNNLPLLAVLLLALGSWHQYFPVPCVRHLYWAGIPAFGALALAGQKIWQLPKGKGTRIVLLSLLAVPFLYCVQYRTTVLVKYFENLPKRIVSPAPGIRGLWVFRGENSLFCTLAQTVSLLPPEIRARGVLNHTPDGIYSCVLPPPAGVRHPMFVNWGNDVYPDYDQVIEKLLSEKRCSVLSTSFQELPGYRIVFGFKHFEKDFRLFVPEN